MLIAPIVGEPPRDVAERLGEAVRERLGDSLERVEVAGPGFLNLFMSDVWFRRTLAAARDSGDRFGSGTHQVVEKILIEFVSAPTRPGRRTSRPAATPPTATRSRGSSSSSGNVVEREYYVNDFGSQVRRFGESIQARARGEEPPEDGYQGDYVRELAGAARRRRRRATSTSWPAAASRRWSPAMQATLERFRRRDGPLLLRAHAARRGRDRPRDRAARGARPRRTSTRARVWLRSTTFGDDKDRVLRRSTGEYTYFAADIAYHQDKRERGYDRVIDIWGADHHGYVARMHAAWQALGGDASGSSC